VDRYRLAVAQPHHDRDPHAERNVARAADLVARAAAAGARLVLFPEGFPGPFRPGPPYDAGPRMAQAAAEHGVLVCWSRTERCADGRYRLVVRVLDREGRQVVRYERAHPATLPPAETGMWVAPGDALCRFTLDGVPMGLVVCSELWVPEPARVLALCGAEVLLSPAGGAFTSLTENWQLVARVRAIENLCHVALTNNRYAGEQGAALIAGPEHVLVASGTDDLLVADLDLARARELRDRDDSMAEPKGFASIPGLLRARRPELYGDLAAPQADAFDYGAEPVLR
jgi:predicted amidohydrolase